jgi:hypothetical protein
VVLVSVLRLKVLVCQVFVDVEVVRWCGVVRFYLNPELELLRLSHSEKSLCDEPPLFLIDKNRSTVFICQLASLCTLASK